MNVRFPHSFTFIFSLSLPLPSVPVVCGPVVPLSFCLSFRRSTLFLSVVVSPLRLVFGCFVVPCAYTNRQIAVARIECYGGAHGHPLHKLAVWGELTL